MKRPNKGTPLWKALLFERRLPWRYKELLFSSYKGGDSFNTLNDHAIKQITLIKPKTVVDFGAGIGKYGIMIRKKFGNKVHIIAIDAFKKTVKILKKNGIYDIVIHTKLQKWLEHNRDNYDLAIFGDVLEHLHLNEIYNAIDLTNRYFKNIIINIPLGKFEQSAIGGNKYEIHRTVIDENFLNKYEIHQKNIKSAIKGSKRYKFMNIWIKNMNLR